MALDKTVVIESINPQGSGQTLTCRLVCWTKGTISPSADNAVINTTRSAYVKGQVAGKTDQELVDEAVADITDQFSVYMDEYAVAKSRGDLVVLSQITDSLPE